MIPVWETIAILNERRHRAASLIEAITAAQPVEVYEWVRAQKKKREENTNWRTFMTIPTRPV